MLTLVLATWMALPLYPLNPVEEDTLNQMSLHVTAGFSAPNKIADPGFQLSAKYELLVIHPLVVRGTADYGLQQLRTNLYPDGTVHSLTLSLEALYYRGTDELTGYVGLGALLYDGVIDMDEDAGVFLRDGMEVDEMTVRLKAGIRATLGLRFSRSFSLEVAVSEVRPTLIMTGRISDTEYRQISEIVRLHDVRITLGYLFSLRA